MAKSKIIVSIPDGYDRLKDFEFIGEDLHFFYDPSSRVLSVDSIDHQVDVAFVVEYFNIMFFGEV